MNKTPLGLKSNGKRFTSNQKKRARFRSLSIHVLFFNNESPQKKSEHRLGQKDKGFQIGSIGRIFSLFKKYVYFLC